MRYARHLARVLQGPVSRNKVRLVFGARQTGKTVLFRYLFSEDRAEFFNLQDTASRRRFEADPAAFGRTVRALPRAKKVVVVDEIQKIPSLLDEVQSLYDEAPARWQFFMTGSSARRLRLRSSNLLPGRSHSYRLYPVCAWETAPGMTGREIAPPVPRRSASSSKDAPGDLPPFPEQTLQRTLLLGSLPGIRAEARATAAATLASYIDHYLEEEIRREALVRDMGPFLAFLKLAASESGQQVNLAKLSQESGVPASSLKNYYQVLVDTYVGHWIPSFSRRTRKRLLTTPRFLFFDLGVRNVAAAIPMDAPLPDALGGPLLEQWVGQELVARAGYLGRGRRVSFWRTSYGVEVDYIWETAKEDLPIEVKWTERPRPEDARHVEIFLDEFPGRARRGLLVCRCDRPQQLTDRVRAIPWKAL